MGVFRDTECESLTSMNVWGGKPTYCGLGKNCDIDTQIFCKDLL